MPRKSSSRKVTSKKVASTASKILKDGRYSSESKVLSQLQQT